MLVFPGYEIRERLYRSARTDVVRGVRTGDGAAVVLKAFDAGSIAYDHYAMRVREYELLQRFACNAITRPLAYERHDQQHAIVLQDVGGQSLAQILRGGPLPLSRFFRIAASVLDALGTAHRSGIVHMDVHPGNIIVSPSGTHAVLIDFDSALAMAPASARAQAMPLQGTIEYMSPEASGRTLLPVDSRSDLYSWGVTMFEMLAGTLPFVSKDPAELLHFHLAKTPPRLTVLNPALPEMLADIAARLLAKFPRLRYRTAAGIAYDLAACERALSEPRRRQSVFTLGSRDSTDRFQVPDILVGRDSVLAQLDKAFTRSRRGRGESVLVTGGAGVGKTSLLRHFGRSVVHRDAVFAFTQCDASKSEHPFASATEALRIVALALLGFSGMHMRRIRSELQAALGSNAAVLAQMLPELGDILPASDDIADDPDATLAYRIKHAVSAFVSVASSHVPLVFVFDDVHLTDSSTADLILDVLRDARNVLLVCSAREDRSEIVELLRRRAGVEQRRASGVTTHQLGGLTEADISLYVAEVLGLPASDVASLARLLQIKTGGNPSGMVQQLLAMHDDGAIRHDAENARWTWDISMAAQAAVLPGMADHLAGRIARLSGMEAEVAWWASICGMVFDASLLADLLDSDLSIILTQLHRLLDEALILPAGGERILLRDDFSNAPPDFLSGLQATRFRFAHQHVREAAMSLRDARQIPAAHLRIGRALRETEADPPGDGVAFEIVRHLHEAESLIGEPGERRALAALSLRSAVLSKRSGNADAALQLLRRIGPLLGSDPWVSDRDIVFAARREEAECAYLLGQFAESELLYNELLSRARSDDEYIQLLTRKIVLCTNAGRYDDALVLAISGLERIGFSPPASITLRRAFAELMEWRKEFVEVDISAQVHSPELRNPTTLHAMTLLEHASSAALLTRTPLFAKICLTMVSTSMAEGNTAASAYGYAGLGALFASTNEPSLIGLDLGELATGLARRYGDSGAECRSLLLLGGFIAHWYKPIASVHPVLELSLSRAVESGNPGFAAYASMLSSYAQFFGGMHLEELARRYDATIALLERSSERRGVLTMRMLRQTVRSLLGLTAGPADLNDAEYSDAAALEAMLAAPTRMPYVVSMVNAMRLLCIHRRFDEALERAESAEPHIPIAIGMVIVAEYHFFRAIALCGILHAAPRPDRPTLTIRARRELRRFQLWKDRCPGNFEDKWALIAAELASLDGRTDEAALMYDRALAAARQSGFLHDEGMICEAASLLHGRLGDARRARELLLEAVHAYESWGAVAKVRELQPRARAYASDTHQSASTDAVNRVLDGTRLDVDALMKAAQAISSELELSELLRTMMRVLIENAGAERGVLLTEAGGAWYIRAEACIDAADVVLHESSPLTKRSGVPVSIVRHAAQSRAPLLLNTAGDFDLYRHDPALRRRLPLSALCLPLIAQGSIVGVVYLEHHGTEGAFPEPQIGPLLLLSRQMGISMQNALLYQRLQEALETAREAELAKRDAEMHRVATEIEQRKNIEIQAAYDELQMRQAQLVHAEKMASLGELTAGIAHEIQNPLNFVISFAEGSVDVLAELAAALSDLTRDGAGSATDAQGVIKTLTENNGLILEHGRRAAAIVRGMQLHARKTSGVHEPVDVHALLDDAVRLVLHAFANEHEDRVPALRTRYEAETADVNADAQSLARVFLNILQNGMYAATEMRACTQGHEPVLRIETRTNDGSIEILFTDNGPGIPPEIEQKIFQPFFTTKPAGTGTGLGLSLSYDIIVKGHGGVLRAWNLPEGGAAFLVTLPLLR